ncbi:L,D-transpeptidase family protein [Rhizobium sp. S95]|uniref:L,D-transpeptidase family protein n=1 Tax=Ciceribacter sichuanensis TaxID=2949647 RepID=A0AAJ1BT96_9HYPH|nr:MULTISPECIES: L,D-transpeptidase family protein [unclassified Ciceribacter]MCM2395525.1 L,D-transpeptidase family protein [Ciceribacter sp. S95]MCM2400085.1 L,D-transpeptidase family protein [Ciceribacter sp. S153]MCO5955947.1 L,D-transpeptidase family protein [Ciceribacter sp. S101]
MSKKSGIVDLSRRAILRGAAAAGAAAIAGQAVAQTAVDELISAPRRGNWDDQFDAQASRATASVVSNTPMLSGSNLFNFQEAIQNYQAIVSNGGWPQVTPAVKLKIGVVDPSVQQLRQRLMISGDLDRGAGMSNSFDTYVDGAVKRFQARHGLPEDGVLGEFTLKALNVSADTRLMQLNVNLQRLQDMMSKQLENRYIVVNIPAAYVEAVEGDRVALRNTAIVGRDSRPSPLVDSKVSDIILNPYWTAPRSIVEKDIVPLMRKDPTYLSRNNIRLIDGKGSEVSPESIDWFAPKAPNLMFRQDPGKINAMSSTKINFPSPEAVYMHDTPTQGLFNKLMRFESSGCVRVQNVRDLIVWVLKNTPGWNRQEIERVIASRVNTPIKVTDEVGVHWVYLTAWSAKDGVVQFRDDIYGKDGNAQLALQTNIGVEQVSGSVEDDILPQ